MTRRFVDPSIALDVAGGVPVGIGFTRSRLPRKVKDASAGRTRAAAMLGA